MTLDDMFDEMDLYGFDDFEDAQKLTLLNEAYFDIVTREPWPFLEAVVPVISAPSNIEQITNNTLVTNSPSDVNAVLSFVDTTNGITMIPERADVIEKNYKPLSDSGTPRAYYFIGDDLFVYPATNGSISYRLYYTRVPTPASTTSDTFLIPSRHHSIIVYGALVKALSLIHI